MSLLPLVTIFLILAFFKTDTKDTVVSLSVSIPELASTGKNTLKLGQPQQAEQACLFEIRLSEGSRHIQNKRAEHLLGA